MKQKLDRAQIVFLVDKLLKAEGTASEMGDWLELVKANVPDPGIQGLIYWPNHYGLGDNPSAEEIVDKALSYKPIQV
ncbi:hypothetical protein F8S13_21420 [Chloroflexia bacterium SDU3-3]|nr:hypothetical protein F8S13_21420 [Chloroflexia bacterium SDU3-3]